MIERLEFDPETKLLTINEHKVFLPVPIYRGRWNHVADYKQGDEVHYGGNVYRATKDIDKKVMPVAEKPTADGEFWMIATNRGRDGRDGKDGEKGERGPEGKPGRDLTQLGHDGSKW